MKTKSAKYFIITILSFLIICFSGCASSKNTGRGTQQPKAYRDKQSVSTQKKSQPPNKNYVIKKYKHNSKPVGKRR
ncbi:hypothetical protein LJC30_01885 [Odoribacter sp. OttesenSCG-928-L07]|nr:hypothetical protein [Odoribacter sp. OttesenSCG-928-L07]MDL2238917.1 hypothetical protein [Bacteroidales bacterium OttesenSCG-928-L14]